MEIPAPWKLVLLMQPEMKILINGLPMAYPISGVGQYTLQLGRALAGLLGPEKVFCFGRNIATPAPGVSFSNGFEFSNWIPPNLTNILRKTPGLKPLVRLWRNQQFKSFVREIKPCLYHETNYAPFSFDAGPMLMTVYDLSFLRHPEWHPPDRVKYLQKYFLKQIDQAEAIITISEFSKKEIVELLNVDPDRIYVTLLGVGQNFTPAKGKLQTLPNEYVLFLGNLEPRKNLPTLINAYRSLPARLRDRYPLVIAGAKAWQTNEIDRAFRSLRKDEKIILTGYVHQAQIPDLYRGASLFIYPSLYEGFGLPVIEAMACGVPVLTSNTTSLPQVVAEAGVQVNPTDETALRQAMAELLEDGDLRCKLSEKGLQRVKQFSWEKCARETLRIYENILKGTR